jgi:opacity protein-like surface antigen
MRTTFGVSVVSLVLGLIAVAPASAQTTGGLITPFIGVVADTPTDENRTVYGGSFGVTGKVVGFELDLGYTPNFFEFEDDFGELGSSGSVTTVMGNLLIGAPLGRVRPYGTIGAGLMRSNLELLDFFDDLNRNDFGINYGGGVMVFVTDNVGIRGDIRQFRSLQNDDLDDDFPEPTDFDLGDFTFWRATAGVTFRF